MIRERILIDREIRHLDFDLKDKPHLFEVFMEILKETGFTVTETNEEKFLIKASKEK